MGAWISSLLLDWTAVPSVDIPDKPKEGDYLDVRLLETTGLPVNKGRMYCRGETCRLWDKLSQWSALQDDNRSVIGYVHGLPGTGKTATAFAWLQAFVKSTGKSATWLHVSHRRRILYRVEFRRRKDGVVCYAEAEEQEFRFASGCIKNCSSAFLVFDGYRDQEAFNVIDGAVQLWAGQKPGQRTAVIVSSYAFSIKAEERVDKQTRAEDHQTFSWTYDEYLTSFRRARSDPDFGLQVSKRRKVESASSNNTTGTAEASPDTTLDLEVLEDIDEKFYYAGGCARYFFGLSIGEVKRAIKDAVETLDKRNIGAVLQRGTNHPETHRQLLAFFEDDSGDVCKRIVSQFAVRQLVEHGQEHAFPVLYNAAYGNPSFEGWVFEADFFFQYKEADTKNHKFVLKGDTVGEDVVLVPHPAVPFDHDGMVHMKGEAEEKGDEIGSLSYPELQRQCKQAGLSTKGKTDVLCKSLREFKKKQSPGYQNGLRYRLQSGLSKMWKPKKWSQGGYDGFYVSHDSADAVIIWFFQVTRGSSHELKLKYFVEVVQLFLDAGLEVSDCQIYFVIPKGYETRVSGVTPHGTLFHDKFGWVNGQEKDKIRVVTLNKTTVTI